MIAAIVTGLLCLAGGCFAQDFLGHWAENPIRVVEWLEDSSEEPTWWMRSGRGQLWGVPELPQSLLALGRRQTWVAWQRTGQSVGLWWDDRIVLQWGGANPWMMPVRLDLRRNGTQGETWPGAAVLSVSPTLMTATGWSFRLKINVIDRRPLWGQWGWGDRAAVERLSGDWLALAAWRDGAGNQPALAFGVGRRFSSVVGLIAGYDDAVGEPSLTLIARRGRLLVRTVHAVHPLLGPRHAWEVSLCGWGR